MSPRTDKSSSGRRQTADPRVVLTVMVSTLMAFGVIGSFLFSYFANNHCQHVLDAQRFILPRTAEIRADVAWLSAITVVLGELPHYEEEAATEAWDARFQKASLRYHRLTDSLDDLAGQFASEGGEIESPTLFAKRVQFAIEGVEKSADLLSTLERVAEERRVAETEETALRFGRVLLATDRRLQRVVELAETTAEKSAERLRVTGLGFVVGWLVAAVGLCLGSGTIAYRERSATPS